MGRSDLKRMVERLDSLPTLSSVAIQLLHQTTDERANAESIARIIESDQSLTARLLRLVNSSSYHFRSEITTVSRAVALMGFNAIRAFALGLAVTDLLRENQSDWVFEPREFWKHALAVAVCSEMIARRTKLNLDPSEAFIAGLLHDLGKVVLSSCMREDYDKVIQRVKDGEGPLLDLEYGVLGASHPEAGKWLSERWGLPELLTQVIWLHHQLPGSLPKSEFATRHIFVVQLADIIVRSMLLGFSGNDRVEPISKALLDEAGVDDAAVAEVRRQIGKQLEERAAVVDLDLPELDLYLDALQKANAHLAHIQLKTEDQNRALRRRERRFAVLHRMNTELGPRQTLDEVLGGVAEALRDGFEVRSAACYVVEEKSRVLQGKFWNDNGPIQDLSVSMQDTNISATESFRQLRPEMAAILAETSLLFEGESWLGFRAKPALERNDLLLIPISGAGRGVGQIIIDLAGQGEHRHFDEEMQEFFAFASAAGLAVARVRVQESLSRRSEELARAIWKNEQTHKQLLHAERLTAVGKMAAGAAHEINNPLAIISGRAQIMLQKEQDEGRSKALQSIVDQCMRASKILQDLMGFARPAPPKTEAANVNTVVHEVVNLFESRLASRGIDLQTSYAPDLPGVYIDKGQIQQVLVNLLMNAEHATSRDGRIEVSTSLHKQGDRVVIRIADSGTGIPPEHLESIFEPFFTTKEEGKGTGLGLSLAYGMVASHQGDINVESEVGKGTVFTIALPITANLVAIADQIAVRSIRERPRPADAAERIMVVDDEDQMRHLIAEALLDAGYLVEEACNGVEALEKLQQVRIDLITLDIRMPRMDGMKMLRMLRETLPDIPVIVLTGLASHEEIIAAKELGVIACLRKPFNLDDLVSAVKNALSQAGAARSSGKV